MFKESLKILLWVPDRPEIGPTSESQSLLDVPEKVGGLEEIIITPIYEALTML